MSAVQVNGAFAGREAGPVSYATGKTNLAA